MDHHKYAVTFHQTISRRVTVGVTASGHFDAVTAVREAIDGGTVLDDSAAMPLLHRDPVPLPESYQAEGMAIESKCILGAFCPDESAIAMRRTRTAMCAAASLVLAYQRSEEAGDGGSIDWSDVDHAFEQAKFAVGLDVESPLLDTTAPRADHDIDPNRLAAEALDEACRFIQRRLGLVSADLAREFFSGGGIKRRFATYIQAELGGPEMRSRAYRLQYDRSVPEADLPRAQALTVDLASCGNPDMGQDPDQPVYSVPTKLRHPEASLAEACESCRRYIEAHGLGCSQWAGGWVRDTAGEILALVSYGGRAFYPRC